MKTILPSITRDFPHDTQVSDLPALEMYGEVWVPFTSCIVSPQLAELRRVNGWAEKDCTPRRIVEYRRRNSVGVSALGRL